MPVLLRDLLDRHVEAVLLEDARLVCERERRKAGPSRNADGDLHVLRDGWRRHQKSGGCGEYSRTKHDCLPSAGCMDWVLFVELLHKLLHKLCRTLFALISLSTALETGNEFVGLAGIDEAHGGQRSCATPGVPVDHQARRAD